MLAILSAERQVLPAELAAWASSFITQRNTNISRTVQAYPDMQPRGKTTNRRSRTFDRVRRAIHGR